ncbi:amidase [Phellopilus nigrolimitatus]|nr:amidase [Phellopilus nigrolimitatus]
MPYGSKCSFSFDKRLMQTVQSMVSHSFHIHCPGNQLHPNSAVYCLRCHINYFILVTLQSLCSTLLTSASLHYSDQPRPFLDLSGGLVRLNRSENGLEHWKSIALRKREDRESILAKYPQWRPESHIPPEVKDVSKVLFDELSSTEIDIVRSDATSLLDSIRDRRYNCAQVIRAYCHAATLAQDLTNCLSEIFFDEALRRAEELDIYMEQTGKPYGPLHGLPVSVKDHIMIKGKDTSTGYIAWCYKTVADNDAVAVDILRKAGAILFVKTNNPQTLLSLETDNNIFERTTNPFNRELTPGGSSGGESALIAFHGSPLGLGTDIGGSIRLPAACTGLYGFKASVGRIPHKGLLGSHNGMDAIVGVLGPIARSARDLALFCRVMLHFEPWLAEPPLLEIPWKQDVVEGKGIASKLCFAILWDDGVLKPQQSILDALEHCRTQLIAAGHTVIDWIPMDHKEAWELITKLYFLDGGAEYEAVLKESGEPPVPQTKWIMSQVPNSGKPFSVAEIFQLNLQREAFRQKLLDHWNNTRKQTGTDTPIDAIITPVAPTLAPRHETTQWWGYTSYWNLADYPAVVFPVGRYGNVWGGKGQAFTTASYFGSDGHFREQWDPTLRESIPVCLQLIGRRLNEEKVLGVLNVVEEVLQRKESR